MAIPNISDYNTWDGSVFNHPDIDANSQKTIDFLTTNYDVAFNSVTASEYVGIPSDQFSTITAGENLSAGDVVRISNGQAFKADNSTSGGITSVVGVCNTAVSSGQTVKIDYGFYNGFSSLTAGTLYYIGTSGAITATKPSLYPVEIGRAVSATRINLNVKEDDKPAGTIITTATTSAPKGYIDCDGSAVSRTTHARLFGELGVIYGNGDGSTTFNLPDYRGRFLRGFDNAAGTDPDASSRTDRGDGTTGDAVGTTQTDQYGSHGHQIKAQSGGSNTSPYYALTYVRTNSFSAYTPQLISEGSNSGVQNAGGNETRPKNITVMYCIKL